MCTGVGPGQISAHLIACVSAHLIALSTLPPHMANKALPGSNSTYVNVNHT